MEKAATYAAMSDLPSKEDELINLSAMHGNLHGTYAHVIAKTNPVLSKQHFDMSIDRLTYAVERFRYSKNVPILLKRFLGYKMNLGISYRRTGRAKEALDHYMEILEPVRSQSTVRVKHICSDLLYNIGVALQDLQRYREALEYFDESNQLAIQIGYPRKVKSAYLEAMKCCGVVGDENRARMIYQRNKGLQI